MIHATLHGLISIPPFYLKKAQNIELSIGEQMFEQHWDGDSKTCLEYLLRSLYADSTLIHQRFYYLLHYAKSVEEKLRCLILNLNELELLIQNDKKNENTYFFLFTIHSLFLAEVYWENEFSRAYTESIWKKAYIENNQCMNDIGLPAVVLNRIPLLKKTKKKFTELLFTLPDDSALFTYAKALNLFAMDSRSKKAKDMLTLSLKLNRYVPEFILSKKRIPKKPIEEIEPGQISEAKYISFLSAESWWKVKGAIDFLKTSSTKHTL